MIPNLFIVGQPKTGTSAVHEYLSQHPEVFMSSDKEPLFFCWDFRDEAERITHYNLFKFKYRNRGEYLSLFEGVTNEKIIGESTTHYLYSKVAAQKIFEYNSQAKILIFLRNPVDFLESYHAQCVVMGTETEQSFQKALELESSRQRGKNIPQSSFCPSFLLYSQRIKYAAQVSRYIRIFPKSNVKIIIYEDFKKNNISTFNDIFKFLEVDPNFYPELKQVNPNQIPRAHYLNTLIFHPRFKYYLGKIMPKKMLANRLLKDFAKTFLWSTKPRPSMDERLRANLLAKYRGEVEKISEILDIDLVEKWNFKKNI